VDIDWESPGDSADYRNFPLLVKAIRDASTAAGKQILITVTNSVDIGTLSAGFNLAALSTQLDFFNIMAYDINGPWNEPPVIGSNTDLSYVKPTIQYMLQQGVPSNKMVLGLAAYGHNYYLANPNCNEPGCSFTAGSPGGCDGGIGDIPYFAIDQYVQSKNYNSLRFNPTSSSMEMVTAGDVWISFDNPTTFNIKASYAASMCMLGTMWWSVDQLASPIVLTALQSSKPPTFRPTTKPSPPPTRHPPTSAPVSPSTAPHAVTITYPTGFCFSGSNTVVVKDRGTILMKDIRIGDIVKDANNEWVRVYSFGHYQPHVLVDYIQIYAKDLSKPLEISKNHLVFVNGSAIPASKVSRGDRLFWESNRQERKVEKIRMVSRSGAYAPFTTSGTILVSGVAVSSYVTLQEDSSVLVVGNYNTIFSMHWLSHVFLAPHRLLCHWHYQRCLYEKYTEDGISQWIDGPMHVSQWLMKQNGVVVGAVFIPSLITALLAYFVEMCYCYHAKLHTFALVAALTWSCCRQSKFGRKVGK
jgi:hypothetical protein